VAFHDAVVKLQPVLGQLRTADAGAGQPLLQVASWGQSQQALPAGNGSQTLIIAFDMAAPAN
jgi:hypothetical protein